MSTCPVCRTEMRVFYGASKVRSTVIFNRILRCEYRCTSILRLTRTRHGNELAKAKVYGVRRRGEKYA